MKLKLGVALGVAAALAAAGLLLSRSYSIGRTTLTELAAATHFHGIAVNPVAAGHLFLATHAGLYDVAPDGTASRLGPPDDLMGFTPHPTRTSVVLASGHPAAGGNLGFVMSSDGGKSWAKVSPGAAGPVDFHQLDVSKANPDVIYGSYENRIQRSADGGRSWTVVGDAPAGLIQLAASGASADVVYAGTETGLMRSRDRGKSWQPTDPLRRPAIMVYATGGGRVYAFVVGAGLLTAAESDLSFSVVNDGFGDDVILKLAAGPGDQPTLYAVTANQRTRVENVRVSRDGGHTWSLFGKS